MTKCDIQDSFDRDAMGCTRKQLQDMIPVRRRHRESDLLAAAASMVDDIKCSVSWDNTSQLIERAKCLIFDVMDMIEEKRS
jgi:hypothetical protein